MIETKKKKNMIIGDELEKHNLPFDNDKRKNKQTSKGKSCSF
jgi:hypothetical protein